MATQTQGRPSASADRDPPKKRKRWLLLVLIVLLAALGAGGGYVVLARHRGSSHQRHSSLPGPTYTLPQLTTNLDDGHIVQLTMVLELAPGDTTAAVTHDIDALNNAAILTFGQMTYASLLPTSGRVAAASALQAAFNHVLALGPAPHDRVVGIEFTSFIVQ